ncbi:hypothetical protein MRB53_026273 [Persea americana]|uniref:Uncharacterized protein n=1 Tax=Persea americana TaxID=3435 RepID=A0ACC2LHH6_PERAE|nr:hypothetical protein MRB53_026273 [Persea americana]
MLPAATNTAISPDIIPSGHDHFSGLHHPFPAACPPPIPAASLLPFPAASPHLPLLLFLSSEQLLQLDTVTNSIS